MGRRESGESGHGTRLGDAPLCRDPDYSEQFSVPTKVAEAALPTTQERMLTRHSSEAVQEAQQVVSRLHQAVTNQDVETALSCYGETYFRVERRAKGWKAGPFQTRDDLRQWFPCTRAYTNTIEFLQTDITKNSAVVVTQETGSFTAGDGTHSWEDRTNLWCLANIEGAWKIIGSVHRVSD